MTDNLSSSQQKKEEDDENNNNNDNGNKTAISNIGLTVPVQQSGIQNEIETKPQNEEVSDKDDGDNDEEKQEEEEEEEEEEKKQNQQQMLTTEAIFDENGERVLQRDIPNTIIVARGKKISFYYERARRILRLYDIMIVAGFGSTVCVACSLVEVLKRNNMANIIKIETKTDNLINYITINNE
eukprot:247075_1